MKKLWSSAKFKRRMLARQRYQERSRRAQNGTRQRLRVTLLAPESFSLISNPEATIRYLNSISSIGARYDLFVDLSRVKFLSCDAIAVLIAAVSPESVTVTGNQPDDPNIRQMLLDSGFFDHVRTQAKNSEMSRRGKVTCFRKRQAKGVNGLMASEMVDFACQRLGRAGRDKPTYAVLGEIMGNTFDHASFDMEGQMLWWATVYCDTETGTACYSFVDRGVGILKSKSFKQRIFYVLKAGVQGAAEQFRALLSRKIPSRTGVPYRGKGLPWVYDTCRAGRIRNLTIITNSVYARPADGVYRNLDTHFHGTFVYWET